MQKLEICTGTPRFPSQLTTMDTPAFSAEHLYATNDAILKKKL